MQEEKRAAISEISFGYLGELRAEIDGRAVDLGPRLQRHLLAILLVEVGRTVATDRLVDLLWGEAPPGAAMASLQAYVSQLRRILEPDRPPRAPARVLVTQDPGYTLKVEPDRVDGMLFLRLAGEGRDHLEAGRAGEAAATLDRALSLWKGPALAEFETEKWAVPVAARLGEARDAALEDRIDAWLALGQHARATSELGLLVEERPLRERRWAQLILATYRSGRQADALRAYQRCRAVLADELGLEPGGDLRRLEAAVLSQDPSLDLAEDRRPPAAVHTVPAALHTRPAVPPEMGPPAGGPSPQVDLHHIQLERIQARIADASRGRGGVVVLIGEPGIGKTTLAEQAADAAEARRIPAVWSRCLDAGAAPAYWPWVQLLRRMPPSEAVEEARRVLEGRASVSEAGNVAKFRAYDAVVEALGDIAGDKGLLCLIDDLHAADDASLDLLVLVSGDLHRLPALFVATLRDTEPSSALNRTLGDLLLLRGTERLAVTSLDAAEVALLAERALGTKPEPAVVEALFERTGGNVFYLLELLRLLASEHRGRPLTPEDVSRLDVPSGVRDVILRRAARLPDNTRTILTLAAVASRDADLDLLEEAARLDSEQLMLALEPAVAAGLLAADDSRWGYSFRHPLIQESIYAGVSTVERRRLHALVAASMESLPDPGTGGRAAQLAHHYLAAGALGDPEKAIAYCRQAARMAMQVGAWTEAVRRLSEALNTAGAVPKSIATRCDVLVDLGRAYRAAGRIQESHQALEESIALADSIGDEERVLSAAVSFGSVALWGSRAWGQTDRRLVELLERQLARIEGVEDERTVRILATLAEERYFDEDAAVGLGYARRGLDLARRLGDPVSLGIALSGYLLSTLANDVLQDRTAVIEEFLARTDMGLGPDVEAVLRLNLLTERLRQGEMARFEAELGRCWELATEVLHSPELQAQLCLAQACRAMLTGDLETGRHEGERGLSLMTGLSGTWTEPARFVMESSVLLISRDLAGHAEEFEQMALRPQHISIPHLAAPAAALGYAQRGERERAVHIAREWFTPPPRSWAWLQPVAYWAQVSALVREPDPAWLYDQLKPHSGELALVGIGADVGGAVDGLLAGLALTLGRTEDALELARAGQALERRAGTCQWFDRTAALLEAARA